MPNSGWSGSSRARISCGRWPAPSVRIRPRLEADRARQAVRRVFPGDFAMLPSVPGMRRHRRTPRSVIAFMRCDHAPDVLDRAPILLGAAGDLPGIGQEAVAREYRMAQLAFAISVSSGDSRYIPDIGSTQ